MVAGLSGLAKQTKSRRKPDGQTQKTAERDEGNQWNPGPETPDPEVMAKKSRCRYEILALDAMTGDPDDDGAGRKSKRPADPVRPDGSQMAQADPGSGAERGPVKDEGPAGRLIPMNPASWLNIDWPDGRKQIGCPDPGPGIGPESPGGARRRPGDAEVAPVPEPTVAMVMPVGRPARTPGPVPRCWWNGRMKP